MPAVVNTWNDAFAAYHDESGAAVLELEPLCDVACSHSADGGIANFLFGGGLTQDYQREVRNRHDAEATRTTWAPARPL